MQIDSTFARTSMAVLVLAFFAIGVGGVAGTVAADCSMNNPEDLQDCENPSLNPFTGMMDNIYEIAYTVLQYSGFVAVFAGVTLWFGTGHNSDRAQIGVWLTIGGLCMIVLFFAFGSLVELLRFIAEG